MPKRELTTEETELTWQQLVDAERVTDLRVLYVLRSNPTYGVGLFFDEKQQISIKFIVSSQNQPLDMLINKQNAVEFQSTRVIPLNMYGVAASLVSRIEAFMEESDRTLQTLKPNNPEIIPYVGFYEEGNQDDNSI